MLHDRTAVALRMLRATTDAARRLHPELGLSFGYIGNLEHARDDRSWSVFAKLSTRTGASGCDVRWGNVATADLHNLACAAVLGDLVEWADRQALALQQGSLHAVEPLAWLETERAFAADWPHRVPA